jgi:orotate phosphoribosyltransferase
VSPYFFNAGNFYRADLLRAISIAFAKTIVEASSPTAATPLEFDIVPGVQGRTVSDGNGG